MSQWMEPEGRDGTPMGLTPAVREGRPIGKVGIGGVDIRAKDGRQMSGDASTASSSSAPPPEPSRPPSTPAPMPDPAPTAADAPAAEATGTTEGSRQVPMRSPIISEEYC